MDICVNMNLLPFLSQKFYKDYRAKKNLILY